VRSYDDITRKLLPCNLVYAAWCLVMDAHTFSRSCLLVQWRCLYVPFTLKINVEIQFRNLERVLFCEIFPKKFYLWSAVIGQSASVYKHRMKCRRCWLSKVYFRCESACFRNKSPVWKGPYTVHVVREVDEWEATVECHRYVHRVYRLISWKIKMWMDAHSSLSSCLPAAPVVSPVRCTPIMPHLHARFFAREITENVVWMEHSSGHLIGCSSAALQDPGSAVKKRSYIILHRFVWTASALWSYPVRRGCDQSEPSINRAVQPVIGRMRSALSLPQIRMLLTIGAQIRLWVKDSPETQGR